MGCFNSKPENPPPQQGCKDNMVVFVPFSERDKFLEKDGSKAVLVYRMIRAAKPPPQPPPCSPKKPSTAPQKGPPPKKVAQEYGSPRPCCTDRRRKPSRGGDCCQRYRPCCCSPHDNVGKADSESHIKEAQTQASCKARVTYFCGSSEDVHQMEKPHHKNRNEIETQTRCQPKVVFVCKSYNGSSTDMDQNQDVVEYIDGPSNRRLQ